MPVTLSNARNITQDKLSRWIIDEFRKSSRLMDMMVFDDNASMGGGSTLKYVYNRITTFGAADFRAINTEYTPQVAETTPFTIELKPFGGSFEIDRVIQRDVRGITNQLELQLGQKTQGTIAKFCDELINGDVAVNPLGFDGLSKALAGTDTEVSANIDLSSTAMLDTNYNTLMDMLDQMLARLNGDISALLMNKALYAVMSGIARRSDLFDGRGKDEFGQKVLTYAGIPLVPMGDKSGTTTPIIGIDATAGTTNLYAVRIGLDGLHGVTPSGSSIVEAYLDDFSVRLASAVKKGGVEMVSAIALKATKAAGVLRGIKIKAGTGGSENNG